MSSFMLSAAPILWLILVILLIVLEVATYQLVAIWFALGAAAALIVSLFELSGTVQIVVFIAVSALSLMASRPLVKNCSLRRNRRPMQTVLWVRPQR